jgi:predicted secreted protein
MKSQLHFGWIRSLAAAIFALAALDARAQMQMPGAPLPPSVTVTATATATVANDLLQASLRAEAENASPAAAASQVNAIIATALADAKAYPAVKVATAGYSTQQIAQKGQPTRWHVTQSIALEAADFTQAATLMTHLQDKGGLLLSSMGFSISEASRRKAEDGVTKEALRSWQERAKQAAQGLGFGGWRVGHVAVQTSGGGPVVYAQMRAQVMAAPGGAPVAVEAGTTEVTVTVSGDAVLQ